jgi:Holliday junction resolvase RusA-like endonuclease
VSALIIQVDGIPRGKGRPRFRKGRSKPFTPERTREYEEDIAAAGRRAMKGCAPFDCALAVDIVATLPIPKSWSRAKQAHALGGYIKPTAKPDFDNLGKAIDGLNGIVWRDDALIVDARIRKEFGVRPRFTVIVRPREAVQP